MAQRIFLNINDPETMRRIETSSYRLALIEDKMLPQPSTTTALREYSFRWRESGSCGDDIGTLSESTIRAIADCLS